jgi:thiol-disulfide isomerase/thioredoxin
MGRVAASRQESKVIRFLSIFLCVLSACATPRAAARMGTMTTLSNAAPGDKLCPHHVPERVCTLCHPELIPKFKAAGDWCVEHEVAESQCFKCHPELSFEPLPALPEGADLKRIAEAGEDVPSLAEHAVAGKFTVFDFYADWCVPCRAIDQHVYALLQRRTDIAVRKLNVVSWDTPLAKRHLARVPALPYLVVYGREGKVVASIAGLDLDALDRAVGEGKAP